MFSHGLAEYYIRYFPRLWINWLPFMLCRRAQFINCRRFFITTLQIDRTKRLYRLNNPFTYITFFGFNISNAYYLNTKRPMPLANSILDDKTAVTYKSQMSHTHYTWKASNRTQRNYVMCSLFRPFPLVKMPRTIPGAAVLNA